ncbi:inward rectifier potassium channel 2-like isoform X2 [Athalia rosae]|uniref:inward rectifier potassium channel 2-like isoform X2 n=1 Tax=Athalia rosae TaxID=37344 RepID=UPI0020333C40|nr:inward rectifier potassium channel 2-like isoform X2 [Athalia rosae]
MVSDTPGAIPGGRSHLGDNIALSGLRRAISQVSMLVFKATSSGEAAWREEFHKYRQTRFSTRRVRKRVVFKHGDCNVVQGNVAKRRRRYLQDIFTTLVDAQWRWTLLVFALNFLLSWLGFAMVWWLIVYSHGDLNRGNFENPNVTFTPCVEDIHSFTSCFLFSVETQHTIGYGSKHTTEECPEAIFVMCIQSMTGVMIQAFMVGIVFAKLSRPKKRTQTLLFSRNAVICQRDSQPCLMFRVGDMRKSHIIEAHVRAQLIKRKVTREGELLPFFQTELKVGGDGEEDKIFFIWPTTIVHKIDSRSPLYNLSASDMLRERFEIVVILEGVIESTGMTTQARSSYLPSEILWGHRFEHIITFRKESSEYEVNYTLFNNTYEVDTPLCSAAQLDQFRALHRSKEERTSSAIFSGIRDDSSSSLATSSGSSLASSTGGLQMQIPQIPPTPIPVTVTGPDDSPRHGSVEYEGITPTNQRLASFYTQDEYMDPEDLRRNPSFCSSNYTVEDLKNQQDYNRVLEDINASLRKNRKYSIPGKEEKKMQREGSRATLESRRSEGVRRSASRTTMDGHQSHSHCGAMKKSPSRSTIDSRHTRFHDSPERTHEPSDSKAQPRKTSLSDGHKSKQDHHHGVPKKTSFVLNDDEPIKITPDLVTESRERRTQVELGNVISVTPPQTTERRPPPTQEGNNKRANNLQPQLATPEEQV